MLRLSCAYVRRELSAYNDEELGISARIAIAEHLADCPACAVEAEDLRRMGDALRSSGLAVQSSWLPSLERFQSEIIGRTRLVEDESLSQCVRRAIEDPIHVWATAAAVTAGAVCLLLVGAFGSMLIDGPASFAALLNARTQDVEILPSSAIVLPRVNAEAVMPAAAINHSDEEESVAAFAALVMPDGNLRDLELLAQESWRLAGGPALPTQTDLLAAVATARFEPARLDGAPVPLNVVWLLTHRTVHGSLPATRKPPQARKTV
jgi:hypothetical protein